MTLADAHAWATMRTDLWPEGSFADHLEEVTAFLAGDRRGQEAALGAFDADGTPLGFAELSIRSHAEDCTPGRIGYLEGWYVVPAARRRGVGRALVEASLAWARGQGLEEFASDALLENEVSHAAHRALGFAETCRIVTFRRAV